MAQAMTAREYALSDAGKAEMHKLAASGKSGRITQQEYKSILAAKPTARKRVSANTVQSGKPAARKRAPKRPPKKVAEK
jgi:hypothetical protein